MTAIDSTQSGGDATAGGPLGEFASTVAHELRSPLQLASAGIELLQHRHAAAFDGEAAQLLAHVSTGLSRATRVLDALRHYAHADRLALRREQVDCNAVVAEVLVELGELIRRNAVAVEVSPLPVIEGDRVLLGQLFQNLIANAIKFNDSPDPEVRVDGRAGPDFSEFAVADNGPGIDPAAAERIFEMFERLHTRGHEEGTGVGLAVCKRIVERHGGRIWVTPAVPAGSIFHFTIATAPAGL